MSEYTVLTDEDFYRLKNAALETEAATLRNHADTLDRVCAELKAHNDSLQDEAATLREEVRGLREKYQDAEATADAWRNASEQLKTAFNGMENAYFAERAAKEAAEQRCAELENLRRMVAVGFRVDGGNAKQRDAMVNEARRLAAASPACAVAGKETT